MNVRIGTIFEASNALEALAQKDLTIATSYRVAKMLKAVRSELETFNEQRIKLFKDMGCPMSEDGQRFIFPKDKRLEIATRYEELAAVEVDIPDKINLATENISIPPDLLIALEPFIEYEV